MLQIQDEKEDESGAAKIDEKTRRKTSNDEQQWERSQKDDPCQNVGYVRRAFAEPSASS